MEEVKAVDVKDMAAEDMGKKLLESLIGVVQSIKRPWAEMTQYEQDDAIEKMRHAVKVATTQAVRLIGSNGVTHVVGTLDQITIKDGVKAVVQIGKNAENLPALFEAQGGEVMIVCGGGKTTSRTLTKWKENPIRGLLRWMSRCKRIRHWSIEHED